MIRLATIEDIPFLNELIVLSARNLNIRDYTSTEIEDAIDYVYGIDKELIEDRTYFIIEENNNYKACGGWSKRKTLFGGDQCLTRVEGYLNPYTEAAKIRAFFIHPNHTRKGLASQLLHHCENQAKEYGFTKIEIMSTMTGAKFYEAAGYKNGAITNYQLPNCNFIKFLKMNKNL